MTLSDKYKLYPYYINGNSDSKMKQRDKNREDITERREVRKKIYLTYKNHGKGEVQSTKSICVRK